MLVGPSTQALVESMKNEKQIGNSNAEEVWLRRIRVLAGAVAGGVEGERRSIEPLHDLHVRTHRVGVRAWYQLQKADCPLVERSFGAKE